MGTGHGPAEPVSGTSATAVRLCHPQHCPLTKIILTLMRGSGDDQRAWQAVRNSLESQKPRSDDPGLLLWVCKIDLLHSPTDNQHQMDIYEEIVKLRKEGRRGAVATIVNVRGSIPSFKTAKMLVRDDGSIMGTIGGGCVEAEVWQAGTRSDGERETS